MNDLRTKEPREFVNKYIFDCVPFIFGGNRENYVQWKQELGLLLQIDSNNIIIVGSAGIGISLNPTKNFKEFNAESDIDVALISSFHFLISWRYLRSNNHVRMRLPEYQKNCWIDHEKKYIYWGTIATDKLLGVLPFGRDWMRAVNDLARVGRTFNRDVKFRIYNDFESLRSYQVKSTADARFAAMEGERNA